MTGRRQYSSDLPQGGLEVPCVLMFNTKQAAEKEKAKRLIEGSLFRHYNGPYAKVREAVQVPLYYYVIDVHASHTQT